MAEGDGEDYMADLSLFLPAPNTQTQVDPQRSQISKPSILQEKPQIEQAFELEAAEEDRSRAEAERGGRADPRQVPDGDPGIQYRLQAPAPDGIRARLGAWQGGAGGALHPALQGWPGREDPAREKARREEARVEAEWRREADLMLDFGSRQKIQWRARRVDADYDKASRALAQLENEEVVEVEKGEGGDGDAKVEEGEEEEEEITEEDLHEILMKLRNEHHYCLYCGCQYESMEMLSSDCPGPNEEDH